MGARLQALRGFTSWERVIAGNGCHLVTRKARPRPPRAWELRRRVRMREKVFHDHIDERIQEGLEARIFPRLPAHLGRLLPGCYRLNRTVP
jgi:hypothetical protein